MEIERLSAKVDVDTFAAERALDSLDHKLDQVARDRTARVNIFYNEHGDTRGGLLGGAGGAGGIRSPWDAPNAADRRIGPSGLFPGREVDWDTGEIVGDLLNLADAGEDVVDVFDELPKVFIPATEHLQNLAKQAGPASDGLNQVAGAGSAAGSGMGVLGMKASVLAGVLLLLLPAITAIGPAIIALGGYVVGLVGAFAPLVGLLFTLPGLFAGLAGIIGVLMLTLKDVIPAIGEMVTAQKEAEARQLALTLAEDDYARALRNKQDAIENVTKARKDAAEQMEDAELSARAAVLGEERAILNLERAYKRLADIQGGIAGKTTEITKVVDYFTGKQFEVARITYDAADSQEDLRDALLSVKEAELGVQIAQDNREDTASRLAELERKGIENSDLVVSALRAQEDAVRALDDASRKLAEANDAVLGQSEEYKNLTPVGQTLVDRIAEIILGLEPLIDTLQNEFFPPLLEALENLEPLLTALEPILGPIARGLGELIAGFTEEFITDENIDKMIEFGEGLGEFLAMMGPIMGKFATAMLDMTIAAGPLIERIIGMLDQGADSMGEWAKGESDVGDLGTWFEKTGDVLEKTLDIMGNLIEFTAAFITAMMPFSTWILDSLVDGSQAMEDWAESADGQNSIASFFESIREPLQAIGSLIAAFATGFMAVFGSDEAMQFLTHFIEVTEEDVLPLFLGLFDVLIKSGFLDGIIELVAGLAALFKGFAAFKGLEDMLSVMGTLMELVGIIFEGIGGILEIMSLISPDALMNKGAAWLLDLFDLDGVRDAVGEWFAKLPTYLATVGGMIDWDVVWEGLKTAFGKAMDVIEAVFEGLWNMIAGAINQGLGPLNTAAGWLGLGGMVPDPIPTWDEMMGNDSGKPQSQLDNPAVQQQMADVINGNYGNIPQLSEQQIRDILDAAGIQVGGGGSTSHIPPGGNTVYMENHFPESSDPYANANEVAWQVSNPPAPAPKTTAPARGSGLVRYS